MSVIAGMPYKKIYTPTGEQIAVYLSVCFWYYEGLVLLVALFHPNEILKVFVFIGNV